MVCFSLLGQFQEQYHGLGTVCMMWKCIFLQQVTCSPLRCTLAELSTALGSGSEVPRRAGWSSSSVEKCGFDNVEKCGARVWSRQCWAVGFPGSPGKIGCRARPVPPPLRYSAPLFLSEQLFCSPLFGYFGTHFIKLLPCLLLKCTQVKYGSFGTRVLMGSVDVEGI